MIDVKEALSLEHLDNYIDEKNEKLNQEIFEYNDLVLKIKKLELKRNRLELCYEHLKKKKPFFLCKKERNIWKEKVETMEEEIMENMELLFKEYIKYERLLDTTNKK